LATTWFCWPFQPKTAEERFSFRELRCLVAALFATLYHFFAMRWRMTAACGRVFGGSAAVHRPLIFRLASVLGVK
jgi:hypothetical protein